MTKKKFPGFQISDQLALPITFVTDTQAILGKKGGGKSYKASVECEELLEHGHQVVVLDPTGAWWGLRSSANGRDAGYPITIFGGDHADVPLESTAGEVLAEAIVADGFSAIIDLTSFTKGEEQRFCAAFLEKLYRINRSAIHLFLDEADVFAPQRPFGEEMRTLGACQSIVRRGRKKGIGCTLITQRPQVLNKDVLSQVDMLTVLRMNHPKDLAAIDEWVGVHGDHELAKEMMASLPSLKQGDAWVWAPGSDIFARLTFRDRRTYDSGRTPRPGEKVASPRLAHVDLERLGEAIKATVERANASDPKKLRALAERLAHRVTELERAAGEADDGRAEKLEAENADLRDQLAKSRGVSAKQCTALARAFVEFEKRAEAFIPTVAELRSVSDKLGDLFRAVPTMKVPPAVKHDPAVISRAVKTLDARTATRPTIIVDARWGTPPPELEQPSTLPPGEHKILRALIQYPRGLTTSQLSVLVGYKRSARNSYISRLVAKQYAERTGERVVATATGRKEMPHAAPLPVGKALRDDCAARLPPGERAVLDVLCAAYPSAMPPDTILKDKYKRSARNSYISRLVARELAVRVAGDVKAADTLFGIDE